MISLDFILLVFQVLFMLYLLGLNLGYMLLNVASIFTISGYMRRQDIDRLPSIYLGLEPPITILAPAFNEETTIVASVRSLLQQTYGDYEVVVVNDGSTDRTLAALCTEFDLQPFPEAMRVRLTTQPIRGIYHSPTYPNLRVVDKENGGKSDALNAGINAARFPLFCAVDADSVLQRNSLERVVQPFLEDPNTIASGGCIRVANGCKIQDGFLVEVGLPSNPLALFQIAEYLRAFLFGRLGWSPFNGLLIISGAFGVFNKERVIEAGGYLPTTVGEDMELVVRLHRVMTEAGRPYRIVFVPDPICWTEVPENFKSLGQQRVRWQRGLVESLAINLGLLAHPRGGVVGWVAFPFMLIFECLGPVVEVAGYAFMVICFVMGLISRDAFLIFGLLSIGLGILLSLTALLLEEMSFHLYGRPRHMAILFLAMIAENLGYRQLVSIWRAVGLMSYILQRKAKWGDMKRSASWNQAWERPERGPGRTT